jgi:hypothetical protein
MFSRFGGIHGLRVVKTQAVDRYQCDGALAILKVARELSGNAYVREDVTGAFT